MPQPVSATSSLIRPSSARAPTVMLPRSVNLTALPSRLSRIWRSLSWSVIELGQVGRDRPWRAAPPVLDHRLDRAQALVDQRLERERGRPHLDPPGLDLGQVEHGVDQRQQMLGADQDLAEVVVLALRQHVLGAPHHQPGEADDGVQRGPSSWLMLARNSDFARFACSAWSLAARSSISAALRGVMSPTDPTSR